MLVRTIIVLSLPLAFSMFEPTLCGTRYFLFSDLEWKYFHYYIPGSTNYLFRLWMCIVHEWRWHAVPQECTFFVGRHLTSWLVYTFCAGVWLTLFSEPADAREFRSSCQLISTLTKVNSMYSTSTKFNATYIYSCCYWRLFSDFSYRSVHPLILDSSVASRPHSHAIRRKPSQDLCK